MNEGIVFYSQGRGKRMKRKFLHCAVECNNKANVSESQGGIYE